jgi:hypothetical protein
LTFKYSQERRKITMKASSLRKLGPGRLKRRGGRSQAKQSSCASTNGRRGRRSLWEGCGPMGEEVGGASGWLHETESN